MAIDDRFHPPRALLNGDIIIRRVQPNDGTYTLTGLTAEEADRALRHRAYHIWHTEKARTVQKPTSYLHEFEDSDEFRSYRQTLRDILK